MEQYVPHENILLKTNKKIDNMHITGVLSNRIGFFGIMTYSMINLLAYLAVQCTSKIDGDGT